MSYDSDEASLLRVTGASTPRPRVPSDLRAELTRAGAIALAAWVEARQKSDFAIFLPYLRRNVELQREYVACFPKAENDYDVLLDDFDEGMKTTEVSGLRRAEDRVDPADRRDHRAGGRGRQLVPHGPFPDRQAARLRPQGARAARLRRRVVAARSDRPPVRDERGDDRHPSHHALRRGRPEQPDGRHPRVRARLLRGRHRPGARAHSTLAGDVDEPARVAEPHVGEPRRPQPPFWKHFYPQLQAAYPGQFDDVELEEFYRAINKVEPSLIRIEADEATYNLHIILRFELEQEILDGSLDLADLPEAWNARMTEYMGVDVPDDAHGVLQDVHWSGGAIGYFPTYSLGNVISVQLWDQVREAIPDLDQQFGGEFGELSSWLRENLHRNGRKFTSKETLERLVGGGIDSGPYLRYLKDKLGGIYGIRAETGAAV